MSKYHFWKHLGISQIVGATLVGATLLFANPVHAQGTTVLTFDLGPQVGNGAFVPQAYGDNVTAATMGDFSYGGSAPFTPNISVLYSGGDTGPGVWNTNYGDLTNVIFGQQSEFLFVTFTPQAGSTVRLNSFDLAGWPDTDYVIDAVQVFADGNPLFEQFNVFINGATGTPRHTPFTFTNLTANTFLTIQIDARNLGNQSDNIGIDNISFSQLGGNAAAAPEPGTLSLLALAGLPVTGAIICRRSRR